ncbi:hypothetical protein AB0L54_24535 [Streptomyces sp. NPDC052196]|uniref:hypothetical protein n=1 Tax=Streptomyces sp. NPDC052196 TaxID=3156691 RepID=UPI002E2A29C8|nr:hypothetical protein [[Kitasatospora] papulosa]
MVLRYIGGHNTKRIGWYVGVTTNTVDYHCRQARKRLSPNYYRILQDTQEGTS